jgi:5'-nucleotidase
MKLRRLISRTARCAAFALALWGIVGAAQPSRVIGVRLIAFNDFHGHLEPGELTIGVADPDDPTRTTALRVGGASFLAALIARLRAERPNHVVVSAGDLVGASPLISGFFHDEATIEVMNAIGLDLNAVGNHEFDRGVTELLRLLRGGCAATAAERRSCVGPSSRYEGARFPFIAANVIDRSSDRTLLPPALIRTFGGVRIGFIGAVTRATPGIVIPSGVAGVRFETEAAALNAQARALQTDGVQAIVAVVHEGGVAEGGIDRCVNPTGPIFDIVRELDPAIDVVVSGHTHRAYRCEIDGRVVIQAASFGRLVSVVDLQIDAASGDVVRSETKARNVPVANGLDNDARLRIAYPPLVADSTVAAIVDRYRTVAAPLARQRVGRIASTIDRTPSSGGDHALGRLIADAHLAATRDQGAQVAFTNPGGIRTELRASGADGTVTYSDIYEAQPFSNNLVTMTLSGAQLKELLEQQWRASQPERARILQPSAALSYAWDSSRPRGQRIADLKLNGRAVAPTDTVRVTVNSFLAAGGDGFRVLREGTERIGGPLDIDALNEFLRARSAIAPLAPDRAPRISRRDLR